RDRRPQPERGPRREQRQESLVGIADGQLEDEPVEMPAELQRDRAERSHPPEHGDLHAPLPPRFVARPEDRALGGLDRLGEPEELLLPRERALARGQRGRGQRLQRVERLELVAVDLPQALRQRESAALAVSRPVWPQAVPSI